MNECCAIAISDQRITLVLTLVPDPHAAHAHARTYMPTCYYATS
jgi:hypothetical protein